ncbi:MAG: cobalt transporter CbiM [Chthonomonadales bacterium]
MHIPDGAISPVTSAAAGAAMTPAWLAAASRIRREQSTRTIPLLSIGAAFCFTLMMFNIPVPGGTTVHPVGAVLLAVLLGPWAATLGVTVALAIQAIFFADGGILALGANCFTMALVMPFTGFTLYRAIAGASQPASARRAIAAGAGAYVGLNAAALTTAVLLGIQPSFFHDAAGRALYFPFPLAITVPALLLPHLAVAGVAEAAVTAFAVASAQRWGLPLYGADAGGRTQKRMEALGIALVSLLALAPLGLLARGEAWGEWSAQEIARRVGYTPARMAALEAHGWKGLLPDYLSDRGPIFYIVAGAIGAILIIGCIQLLWHLAAPAPRPQRQQAVAVPDGQLPGWLLEHSRKAEGPPRLRIVLPAGRYLERTLASMAEALRDAILTEEWARRNGFLQSVRAEPKLVGTLVCVISASLLHTWKSLLVLYGAAMVLAVLSKIPVARLVMRVWIGVGLFSGLVVLPSALNLVTPGRAAVVLHAQDPTVTLTVPGLLGVALFAFRVGVAMTFVTLLTFTTPWMELLAALQVFRLPRSVGLVLAVTYRYLAVLLQIATDMFEARRSRTIGRLSLGTRRRMLGSTAGVLFGKSMALTDEVHMAMVSRGWDGTVRSLPNSKTTSLRDAAVLALFVSVAVTAVALERWIG